MNDHDVHPIELFLAALINLFEFICYIINDIAGHHQPNNASGDQTTTTTPAPIKTTTTTPATPQTNPLFIQLQSLTIKQLQAITGIKSSRYRKSDLILIAVTC